MTELGNIVDVQIQTATRTPTRPGFAIPMIIGYHTGFLDLVRTYDDPATLITDGIPVTNEIYKMAAVLMSQSPRPASFKVGRLAGSWTHIFTLTFTEGTPTTGRVVSVSIGGETASYTVAPADTITLVHTGLATAINAMANTALHTAVGAAGQVTVTVTAAGSKLDVTAMSDYLNYADTTAIGTLTSGTELDNIRAADDNWYGMITDARSEARIGADAAWAQLYNKLYVPQSSDAIVGTSSATDIASDLKAAGYSHVPQVAITKYNTNFLAAGMLGYAMPLDPGTYTWVFKNIAGVSVDTWTASQKSFFRAKYVTWYEEVAGLNITQGGKTAGGGFIDSVQTVDWLISEIETSVFTLLANTPKVPFTDAGIRMISDCVKAVLQRAEDTNLLANTPKFTCTSPLALDIATADRANRILNKIEFTGRLAGAIHKVIVRGTLTV